MKPDRSRANKSGQIHLLTTDHSQGKQEICENGRGITFHRTIRLVVQQPTRPQLAEPNKPDRLHATKQMRLGPHSESHPH